MSYFEVGDRVVVSEGEDSGFFASGDRGEVVDVMNGGVVLVVRFDPSATVVESNKGERTWFCSVLRVRKEERPHA